MLACDHCATTEQGLLTSERSASGQRTYTDDAIDRVQFIQGLYAAGLSSKTIVGLLPCVEAPNADHTDEAWTRLLEERARLVSHIDELLQTRTALDELIVSIADYRAGFREQEPEKDAASMPLPETG